MSAETSDLPLFMELDDADPAVGQASSEAKRTFPHFLNAVTEKLFPVATYWVKVPFIDRSGTGEQALVRTPETASKSSSRPLCHLWLRVNSVLDDLVFCNVGEAPEALQLQRGTSFVIAGASIEDWLINNDGTAFGGFSLRVIRGRLSKGEQLKFDAHAGIREFRTLPYS
ncbi:MAG: DUF2314 domain-containing protein [Tepidisphaeraceae bacterium]|jgi:hypothetical protein